LHVKKAIPYSQAIRYRRIIEDNDVFTSQIEDLKQKFITRGYPKQLLNEQIHRVFELDRDKTLAYKTTSQKQADFKKFLNGCSFLPLIITYHDSLPLTNFRSSFLNQWDSFIKSDDDISEVFKQEVPQIVYKRGRTLGNNLVRSKFRSEQTDIDRENIEILAALLEANSHNNSPFAVNKCNEKRCKCCENIGTSSVVTSTDKKLTFPITENFNCNSKNVIYLITCKKCQIRYVGQTSRSLKERLNNHRSDIRLNKNTAVAKHFNSPQHNVQHLTIIPIHNIENLNITDRLHLEKDYMKALDTIYPKGMNFYPLV
jgi:hypothetical protein